MSSSPSNAPARFRGRLGGGGCPNPCWAGYGAESGRAARTAVTASRRPRTRHHRAPPPRVCLSSFVEAWRAWSRSVFTMVSMPRRVPTSSGARAGRRMGRSQSGLAGSPLERYCKDFASLRQGECGRWTLWRRRWRAGSRDAGRTSSASFHPQRWWAPPGQATSEPLKSCIAELSGAHAPRRGATAGRSMLKMPRPRGFFEPWSDWISCATRMPSRPGSCDVWPAPRSTWLGDSDASSRTAPPSSGWARAGRRVSRPRSGRCPSSSETSWQK